MKLTPLLIIFFLFFTCNVSAISINLYSSNLNENFSNSVNGTNTGQWKINTSRNFNYTMRDGKLEINSSYETYHLEGRNATACLVIPPIFGNHSLIAQFILQLDNDYGTRADWYAGFTNVSERAVYDGGYRDVFLGYMRHDDQMSARATYSTSIDSTYVMTDTQGYPTTLSVIINVSNGTHVSVYEWLAPDNLRASYTATIHSNLVPILKTTQMKYFCFTSFADSGNLFSNTRVDNLSLLLGEAINITLNYDDYVLQTEQTSIITNISTSMTIDESKSSVNYTYNGNLHQGTYGSYAYLYQYSPMSLWTNYFNVSYYIATSQGNYEGKSNDIKQYVENINLLNCSSSSTNISANYNFYDENSPTTRINSDIEYSISYWVSNKSLAENITGTLNNIDSFNLCMMPFNESIYIDTYIKHNSTGSLNVRYYEQNSTNNNVTRNVSLYNFISSTGVSDAMITIRTDDSYSLYSNVLAILQRSYVGEGVWRSVQYDKSDQYGLTHFNILEETTDYRLIYLDANNNVLTTTGAMKFICDAGICQLTQLLGQYEEGTTSPALDVWMSYSDASKNVSVYWNDPLGITTSLRALVTKQTLAGSSVICNSTKTGASGVISCNVGATRGNFFVEVYSTASPEQPFITQFLYANSTLLRNVVGDGKESTFWTAGIMITLTFFGMTAGGAVGALVGLTIGAVFVSFAGLSVIKASMMMVLVIMVLVLIVRANKK